MFDKMQHAEIINVLTKDFSEVGVILVASKYKVFLNVISSSSSNSKRLHVCMKYQINTLIPLNMVCCAMKSTMNKMYYYSYRYKADEGYMSYSL